MPSDESQYSDLRERHLLDLQKQTTASYMVESFAKYASRQELTRFLFRHEVFKKIIDVKGSVVECGVFSGQGLMAWAQLSSILEPVSFNRKIYGFDTFDGFPNVHLKDKSAQRESKPGDLRSNSFEELQRSIELFNLNRLIPQVEKVHLIKGDFLQSSEKFLKDNPHTLVALLYLDFDLYEPTKKALQMFLPRMPKGAVIGFDEVNNSKWPGETVALLEEMNLNKLRLQKFYFEPHMSYAVLE